VISGGTASLTVTILEQLAMHPFTSVTSNVTVKLPVVPASIVIDEVLFAPTIEPLAETDQA
jgi:hypothetical protein